MRRLNLQKRIRIRHHRNPPRRHQQKDQNVLLIDDLLATGGTIKANIELIEKFGGKIVGLGFLIELEYLRRQKSHRQQIRSILINQNIKHQPKTKKNPKSWVGLGSHRKHNSSSIPLFYLPDGEKITANGADCSPCAFEKASLAKPQLSQLHSKPREYNIIWICCCRGTATYL